MKKYFKNTWVSYVIALVLSFMLFIVEPINLYANNLTDFWFDLGLLLKPSLLLFLGLFLAIVVISNIIYFINKKLFKIYNIVLFISFLCTYIQGNFLAGNLPVLSGDVIDWSKYFVDNLISIALWVVVIVATIIICKKSKMDKYIKYSGYISLAIFAMISVSLVSTLFTTEVLDYANKDFISASSYKNYNKFSTNKNFIIFLLDTVDSRYFNDAINNNKEFANTLSDFTYYPDTMSVHPFTQESIPLVLTNSVFENQDSYQNYLKKAIKESPLFEMLSNKNYEINVYDGELSFDKEGALKVDNVDSLGERINYKSFIKQELKYDLFRYLPFFLKKYSRIETMNFSQEYTVIAEDIDYFSEDNSSNLNHMKNEVTKESKNNFKFVHLDGSHVPFTYKKDLTIHEETTYKDEIEASLHITDIYLNLLKENNVYDNSAIIVLADHGFNFGPQGSILEGRQNPILYVKGFNEKHDKTLVSDKAVSFTDLNDIYKELLDGKSSSDILKNVGSSRVRRYLMYHYTDEIHMSEYETKDKAWETDKLYKTGKEFNAN